MGYIYVTKDMQGGNMSRSGVLERSAKTLADLDAFVDESIDAKNEKEMNVFKKITNKIMRDSKRRIANASRTAPEKVRSV